MFGPKFIKNPTSANARKDFFTRTVSSKESSFAIIAIRCNSEESTGKRKITPGITYQLLQEYLIDEESIIINEEQKIQSTLYDDFYHEEINDIPHILISAIVGQNGSGKSSIIEFMMRLINNFAAATIGEMQNNGQAAERLHFIDGVDGELWYILESKAYHLKVKNCSVKLFKFIDTKQSDGSIYFTNKKIIFNNEKSENCRELIGPHVSLGEQELKVLYECFFYTLITNQSVYAYNTFDFEKECNSDQKEASVIGAKKDETFDIEDKCWLHGLFHKNDAYRAPLVITPFRREGNIDINNEHNLAIERLVRLYTLHEDLRIINDHLLVESLTYSYMPEQNYGLERIKKKLHFNQLTLKGYELLKNTIVTKWGNVLNRKITDYQQKSYYKEAIEYLVYKTLKVSYQYKEHRDFYDATYMMEDVFNQDTLEKLIQALTKDHSHITRKIYQTLAYLIFNVFELQEIFDTKKKKQRNENTIKFEQLGSTWWKESKLSKDEMKSPFMIQIRVQAIVPPPFLSMRINLCEKNNSEVKIDFETLSSGEKQQIFTISSILYHLDNIDSAHKDKSSINRVRYQNVCVVLEEIELYYHPQLQQQFVYYILNSLKQITLKNINGLHLIIVTHSPYVLSDIPHTNVLALKKDEKEPIFNLRSFGANVHDILKDSFFLEGGAIGIFAQWEVAHLMACMKVHQWAKDCTDTKKCPFINDENAFAFLNRYLYSEVENPRKKLFSYELFNRDFSAKKIKIRILSFDELVIYHILMEEYSRTFPSMTEEQKQLRKIELQRQLDELDNM